MHIPLAHGTVLALNVSREIVEGGSVVLDGNRIVAGVPLPE